MTCTAACAAGMLNSTPVMSCTPSPSGSITIIDTPSPRGTTPNVHGRALHTMSCRYSTVAYYTAWHATQRGMRHSVACDTRVACDTAWHVTHAWHVTQRGMRHSVACDTRVACDTAWACPQVPVDQSFSFPAGTTAAAPSPAQDVVIIDSDGDDMLRHVTWQENSPSINVYSPEAQVCHTTHIIT